MIFILKILKVSEYNLIYIYCTNKNNEKMNYIKCYSLNGIKFTELITDKKIVDYFIKENLLVVYENNLIESFNLYEIEENNFLNKLEPNKDKDKAKKNNSEDLDKNKNKKIVICLMNNIENKLIIIYEDNQVLIEDVSYLIFKE